MICLRFTVYLLKGKYSDITSPEKEQSPELDQQIAEEEYEIAKLIFTPVELSIYEEFEEAGKFLKGQQFQSSKLNTVGIYSQLLDKVDANLMLHMSLARWASSPSYNPSLLRSERSLTYVFRQYERFHLKLSDETLSFYANTVQVIKEIWLDLQAQGITIPTPLTDYLR